MNYVMVIQDLINSAKPVEYFELRGFMRHNGRSRERIAFIDPSDQSTIFFIQQEDQ